MKKNILVFPCGSEIGLEIYRSLSFEKNIVLFGGSSVNSDPGKMFYENYYDGFPYVNDDNFISYLNEFIENHNIDILYPAMDSVILKVSEHKDSINCKVICSPKGTVEICMSKLKSYKYFEGKFNTPTIYNNSSNMIFPLFTKPDIGYGSRNTAIVSNQEELFYYQTKLPNNLLLEYLPGKEFTIDCFSNFHGELIFIGARERKRIVNGISASAVPVESDKFNEIANIINDNLKFNGAWFFQVKEDHTGELCLLEIAPRIAGVSGLYRNLGINLPLLNIINLENIEIEVLKNKFNIELEKSFVSNFKINYTYEHVYIDFDDTLIINSKVNLNAINFIYKSINDGCKIHLITRHLGDLHQEIRKYRLENLFDEIIWLKDGQLKSDYIKHNKGIFIDDAYSERKDVFQNSNIPVFSVDAIECLL
ncbi:ATP-grasp domain-containing protein [Lysinibacillus sp. SGAir0095]|uniref:ATP-grasp domain-containing protein n=1 Tax=Lysinibacillus sp. SGAir0095 TaxID=2070463 RepID=UPI0010CCBB60|nr:ATP-grasp domain-containing protein [Lysinibacillus sp. SGAir0095]QCR31509.1 carbamoylphosphate synthase large subunit short form [Lysinibacillus sp. SGAir0095]